MAISTTNSLASVVTMNQGFMSHEIEDEYNSHIDLNGFCTVDNNLQGVPGDIRTINTYGASGTAIDVAEGNGNSNSIATTLVSKEYQIKCAQAWFRYSDEAEMRDPVAVQTGTTHLGTALFNKVNADIFAEFNNATLGVDATSPDFDAFVDAVSMMTIKDAAGENAMDAQQRFIPQVFALMHKKDIAKARKAMKDQIVYDPRYAWTPGYVGSVAGVSLYYKQDAVEKNIVVGTRKAVTVFNKTGVNYEVAARSGGTTGSANLRFNDIYVRKYYLAALTDASQVCQLVLTGGLMPYSEKVTATNANQKNFTLTKSADSLISVTVNGVAVPATVSTTTLTLSEGVASGTEVDVVYRYVTT